MKESNSEQGQIDEELSQRLTRQIARGSGIALFGRVSGRGLRFLFQVLLTRVLGVGAYGLYSLGYTVLRMTNIFSQFGLQNGVVRFGSMYRGEEDRARLKGTLLITLIVSFLSGIVVSILLHTFSGAISRVLFREPDLVPVLEVFAFSLPFYTVMMVSAFAARVFRKMQYEIGVRLILHPFSLIALAGLSFYLGYGLMGVVYGFLIATVVSTAVGIGLLWRLFPELITGLKPELEVKKILFYSLTVFLTGLSSLLISRIDRFMLGILGTAEDVGVYNAAAIMAAQATIFLVSFNAIFSPIVSDLYNKDKIRELGLLFKITTRWILAMTLPIFLVFVLFSRGIMKIFGTGFGEGWMVLIGLGFAQLLNAAVGSSGFILNMTGHQKTELGNNLVLGGMNVLLNFFLIPRFGIQGAALATGISIASVNVTRLVEVKLYHDIHPYKWSYWKPIAAGLGGSLVLVLLKGSIGFKGYYWVLGAVFFFLIYAILFFLIGLDSEDRLVLDALKKKIMK